MLPSALTCLRSQLPCSYGSKLRYPTGLSRPIFMQSIAPAATAATTTWPACFIFCATYTSKRSSPQCDFGPVYAASAPCHMIQMRFMPSVSTCHTHNVRQNMVCLQQQIPENKVIEIVQGTPDVIIFAFGPTSPPKIMRTTRKVSSKLTS